MKKTLLLLMVLALGLTAGAKEKVYVLTSPVGRITTHIVAKEGTIHYDIVFDGTTLLKPSPILMEYSQGEKGQHDSDIKDTDGHPVFASNWMTVKKVTRRTVDETVVSPFTRQATMRNRYNELTLHLKEGMRIVFRAYNEGIAYRFVWEGEPGRVYEEPVEYNFPQDWKTTAPYVIQFDSTNHDIQYTSSFENQYTTLPLSQLDTRRLCFLPLLVHGPGEMKLCITESALLDYPGLYLHGTNQSGRLIGEHAPLPKQVEQGGYGNLQLVVKAREDYIADMDKGKVFPWRILMVAENSTELAKNNMSYLLGEPSRVEDLSWIRPGKVAWDWWNNWNISGVDFEAGINNDTYKHYIDFAAKYGLEYVIMDEGWAVGREANLFHVVPAIDLPMLVDYARERGVGIILWAGYYAFERDMEKVCRHYSEMGVKGFKIDFMNRDDQLTVDFYRRAAEMCAKYHLVVDFHGAFKPAGFTRTYPNVLNFEGVFGLEQMRWSGLEWDQMRYDTEIPFIRQLAGPMDYTPGAMRNGTRNTYRPNWMEPMSQGTRCHQLALYLVLDAPLTMLCDSPTNYDREPDFTRFIASIPTVWDETRVVKGAIGEYFIIARRKGDTWYVAGINNWEARDIDLLLYPYTGEFELYSDGANAHRNASDYSLQTINSPMPAVTIHMAPGGGFVAKFK